MSYDTETNTYNIDNGTDDAGINGTDGTGNSIDTGTDWN